jgi:hypothetical protein
MFSIKEKSVDGLAIDKKDVLSLEKVPTRPLLKMW